MGIKNSMSDTRCIMRCLSRRALSSQGTAYAGRQGQGSDRWAVSGVAEEVSGHPECGNRGAMPRWKGAMVVGVDWVNPSFTHV